MRITKQARRDAKRLFRGCQIDGLLSEEKVRQTVNLLATRKPRSYQAMLQHFTRLVKLELNRRAARIETVVPLTEELQSAMVAGLNQRYGAGLAFTFVQNPGLVGGARVQVGSDVIDGSIHARLMSLQENF